MVINSKTIKNELGEFVYTKHDVPQEFVCSRCTKTKKSKNIIEWTHDGEHKTICNGCYGRMLSKQEV